MSAVNFNFKNQKSTKLILSKTFFVLIPNLDV